MAEPPAARAAAVPPPRRAGPPGAAAAARPAHPLPPAPFAPVVPLAPLRRLVAAKVEATFDGGNREDRFLAFRAPAGDPGWFGPGSVAWQVHADLGSMLVGGLSALLLQTLHPLVMQGVADHSNYRTDPLGRLRRTADFLALTTYGASSEAEAAVRLVRRIHTGVRGVAPDGRGYRASDPELLAYVHVTEVWSFLRAFQRYSGRPLLLSEKNRYLGETAYVGERLGARDLPRSTDEVRRYLRLVRPQLVRTPAAVDAVDFLRRPIGRSSADRAAHAVLVEAAIDLLPPFARRELRLGRPLVVRRGAVRPTAAVLSFGLRAVLGRSPLAEIARTRAASEPGSLSTPGASLVVGR